MAKKIDLTPTGSSVGEQKPREIIDPSTPSVTIIDSSPEIKVAGLTEDEERDPNNIIVTVSDPAPVVVLFGAGASGKTMTLIRLTRYLKSLKLKVEPDTTFRPSQSKHYQEMCENFATAVNDSYAADRTRLLSFMLVKVMDEIGRPICQILEAPGEHYFNTDIPNATFPTYINNITQLANPKIWVFIVEKGWKDQKDRSNYANKICEMLSIIDPKDRVIFTCHKADLHRALIRNGIPNRKQFFLDIRNQYPNIFANYVNRNPITKLWRTYNFDFVVFSAGTFNPTADGRQVYNQGKDIYPKKLWVAVKKAAKGRWW
jgi:hypothetical protein